MTTRHAKPVELSVARFHPGRTISALLVPQTFSRKPEFTLNMEQVLIGSWDRYAGPYCTADSLQVDRSDHGLDVTLRGELDAGTLEPDLLLPYTLRLVLEAEPYRVRVRGEMLELDYPLVGFTPCLYSFEFSKENHPPFEMARKSFMYFEGKGFTWLSDAERTRSEWHRDPPVDDGGPWIQLYTTRAFAGVPAIARRTTLKEIASVPLAGWVANDDAYLVAVADRKAFQGGIRWGPCLHADSACEPGAGDRTFEMMVYAIPADLELLRQMVQEDFPESDGRAMSTSVDTLWPRTPGWLLNDFEGDDLLTWHTAEGVLGPYKSERVWINGNLERVTYAEGYTEGKGAALWEIPPGTGTAVLSGSVVSPTRPGGRGLTHIAIDALNRGESEADVTVTVGCDGRQLAQLDYRLHFWANRRLLLPLQSDAKGAVFDITLTVEKTDEPTRLVLDNLRGFSSGGWGQ